MEEIVMKNENTKTEYLYFCERIKPNNLGFRERIWLDSPCKGWKVLSKKGLCPVESGLRF